MKYVRYKARMIRAFIGLGMIVSLLVMLTGCWPFNTFPVAYFTASPLSGPAPLSVAFSAMLSEDPDGFILKWEWDFGDGSSGTGESASHTYTGSGTFTVVLRVTDDDRATATVQRTITVTAAEEPGGAGAGPTASFTATPLVGAAPLTVTFNASASAYAGHAITYYSWDFGDGVTGTGMTTTHTYAPLVTTTYNVVLRIIAADNTEGTATKSITATVTPATPPTNAPTASFSSPGRVVVPKRVACDPSNSSASGDRTLTEWIWRFGDGMSPRSMNTDDVVYHRYTTDEAEERFTITLIVIDNEDGVDAEAREIIAENKQPVAGFEIYDTLDVSAAPAVGDTGWKADDVEFTGVQTGARTVWIQSQAPDNWVNMTPSPNTEDNEPNPKTGTPSNYASHNLSYDPEGQDWTDVDVPPVGFPHNAWGIMRFEIDWGDGSTPEIVAYATGMNKAHIYQFTGGTQEFVITVIAIDYFGARTSFSRKITMREQP